jgi:predicted phage tail protein
MEDINKNEELQVKGAKGGGGSSQKVTQNVTVVAPTRQPVIADDNLFSVAFAKTVYAVSEGEIEGFPNSIEKDVYLDGVPIQNPDGTSNFDGYTLESRLGEDETQTPIEGFSTTENTVGVSTEITQAVGPIVRAITDKDIERCRVIISHPALQSQNPKNGDVSGTSVRYNIEVSANGGPYSSVVGGLVEVSGKSDSEFQRAYEFDLPGTGPWNVRVSRLTADNTSAYIQNNIFWQSYAEIIDEKFAYPNTALVAVKVDARQFNAIPDVSVKLRGKRVQVPSNYNAETRTYTGIWDGTFQMAWTDNPAWIFRDIVLNERFGVKRYVSSIAIDPWYLYTVSQYCDELVPSGSGGYEPRFTCNVFLQNPGGVYEVLNALASCFRGLIYYSEGQLYLTQDRSQLPVQQFSEANVIQNVTENGEVSSPCFTYTGTARAARKSVVLANWDDPNQVYSSVTEYLQDDQLLERFGYNPIDLRLIGVTSRGQALRAAKHTLFSNRYETERVSFRIGAEGLAAGVGEVIQVADPLKQGQRLGGRIRSIDAVNNRVVLDAVLTLDENISYTLTLVIPDGETVTNPDGTTVTRPKLQVFNIEDFTTLSGASEVRTLQAQNEDIITTQAGDALIGYTVQEDAAYTVLRLNNIIDTQTGALWVLEWSELNAALYKIISVAEVEPLVYQVEAVQYNDSKFGYVDNSLPVAIPKDRFTISSASEPTDFTAELHYSNGQTSIRASWKAPQQNNAIDLLIRGYRYQWRKTGDTEWSDVAQQRPTSVEIPLSVHVFGSSYQVRVASVNRLGSQSDWVVYDVDPFEAIPDLSDTEYNAVIRHQNQPDGTHLIIVDSGTCPIPERVSGYRCAARPINVPGPIPGVKEPDADGWYFLANIPLTGYYTIAFHAPGDWEIRVAFTSAIFGESPDDYLYDTVDREEIVPPTPSLFTVVENETSGLKRFSWQLPLTKFGSWDQGVVSDVISYEVRYKQGGLVDGDPSATWERGIELYSGGVAAQQQWFETGLFDKDEWTVMVKSVDATQWRSDEPAYILVNINAPLINNAVYDACVSGTFPGTYINAEVASSFYLITQNDVYLTTQDGDTFYEDTDVDALQQIDPSKDSYYTWTFDNNFLESALLITTTANTTYQHRLGALTGTNLSLLQEDDNEVLQENEDDIFAEQRNYTEAELSGQAAGTLHPYAPFEKLTGDTYLVETLFKSLDGFSTGKITSLCYQLDYPDVIESQDDVSISSSVSGTAIPLNKSFRAVKSVQITLQDTGTGAINALVLAKTTSSITVKCVNSSGTAVSGLIDMTVVGY